MKVLHINVVYPTGSTGKIVHDIVASMGVKQSYICFGRGKEVKSGIVKKFCTEIEAKIQGLLNRLGGLQFGGNFLSTRRLIKIIKKVNPEIVHLHCINGYCVNVYRLLGFLAVNNFKTVITHHAEFYYTGSCSHAFECDKWCTEIGCKQCPKRRYASGTLFFDNTHIAWNRMKDIFRKFKKNNLCFVAVSPWVKYRSLLSPIVNQFECDVVMNGLNTKMFYWKNDKIYLKNILKEDIVCLYVTASFDVKSESLKGGYYILELAKRHPLYKFVVVSAYTNCSAKLPNNVLLWGRANNQEELANLYRRANVTILTSKRETFSMVLAESLCCGTPVVGFRAGGPETITLDEYCTFVNYPNIEELSEVLECQMMKKVDKSNISRKAIEKYDSSVMVRGYIDVYNKLLMNN